MNYGYQEIRNIPTFIISSGERLATMYLKEDNTTWDISGDKKIVKEFSKFIAKKEKKLNTNFNDLTKRELDLMIEAFCGKKANILDSISNAAEDLKW